MGEIGRAPVAAGALTSSFRLEVVVAVVNSKLQQRPFIYPTICVSPYSIEMFVSRDRIAGIAMTSSHHDIIA